MSHEHTMYRVMDEAHHFIVLSVQSMPMLQPGMPRNGSAVYVRSPKSDEGFTSYTLGVDIFWTEREALEVALQRLRDLVQPLKNQIAMYEECLSATNTPGYYASGEPTLATRRQQARHSGTSEGLRSIIGRAPNTSLPASQDAPQAGIFCDGVAVTNFSDGTSRVTLYDAMLPADRRNVEPTAYFYVFTEGMVKAFTAPDDAWAIPPDVTAQAQKGNR